MKRDRKGPRRGVSGGKALKPGNRDSHRPTEPHDLSESHGLPAGQPRGGPGLPALAAGNATGHQTLPGFPAAPPVDGKSLECKCYVHLDEVTGEASLERPPDAPTPSLVDLLHRVLLDGGAYAQIAGELDARLAPSSVDYAQAYLDAMTPRNPMERMLASQILLQHARISSLIRSQCRTKNPGLRGQLDRAIDSAMNVARRQALAWDQLRSPRPVQYIAGQQINVAGQQVVANAPLPPAIREGLRNATNEQG